jgi:ribonuclease HII
MTRVDKMKTAYSIGETVEMGIDEAGRGCFWGPIVAGAVIWPPEEEWTDEHRELVPFIRDSKKTTKAARPRIAAGIQSLAVDWGVGFVTSTEVNDRGMTWANQEAFRRAIDACYTGLDPELLLIDGVLGLPDTQLRYECIPGGDGLYIPIAAASILAKHGRDSWVTEWSKEHPVTAERYDLLSNMGYGTVKHREGLKKWGAHELHRGLFIRNWLS